MKTVITRISEFNYSVSTDVLLSDFKCQSDSRMKLVGNVLKPDERKGDVRISTFKMNLGPVSFLIVQALKIGESATFGG